MRRRRQRTYVPAVRQADDNDGELRRSRATSPRRAAHFVVVSLKACSRPAFMLCDPPRPSPFGERWLRASHPSRGAATPR